MLNLTYHPSLSVVPHSGGPFDLLLEWHSTEQTPRLPLNLSLVLDRSGSMAGQPLRQAIIAATRVVETLTPQDTLSIVIYDDAVETLLPPTLVTNPASIVALLRGVQAGGLTNLSGGWLRGCELVAARHTPQVVSRVLLLTDGQANVGVQNPAMLARAATEQVARGVTTTTLGFGEHFNEDLLIQMAQAGRGNYYFIQSPDDAASVFSIELDSLRALAAQNLTVRITPRTGVQVTPLNILRSTSLPDGAWEVEVGDVYEGEGKPLALAFALDAVTEPPASLVIAEISYHYQALSGESIAREEATAELSVPLGTMAEAMAAPANTAIVQRLALLRLAQAKDVATRQADHGERAEAIATLRAAAAAVQALGLGETYEIAEELEQIEYFAQLIEQGRYDGASRKEMRDQAYQGQTRQRSDLMGRGTSNGDVMGLPRVAEAGTGIEVECVREGGKLRVRAVSAGFDPSFNVQFPRALRFEGAHYVVEGLELSANGGFYRAVGTIQLIVRPGEEDRYQARGTHRATRARPVSSTLTLADLQETDQVGNGVMIQVVKDKSKLRARVVSDGFDPDKNMRFPRSIRQEGILFVVDGVSETSDGKSYIAHGTIRRFVQP